MSAKGGNFEREIAKAISLWWSSGKSDAIFWRTHSSGARATTRAKKGQRLDGQYGDLCATDPSGLPFTETFTVSLKRGYKRHSIASLFDKPGNKGGYREFIDEAIATSNQAKTPYWMLIVKRDHQDALVILPSGLLRIYPVMRLEFCWNKVGYFIDVAKLTSFFKYISPTRILTLRDIAHLME